MAGTPTTNYNIPTYADTDAPDLSGAYNDAMGIIDTQLKANADAIESASTGNYTGTAPITVDNEGRTIGVQYAAVNEEGVPVTRGAVDVTGVANNITSSSALNGTKVPNLRAVADYVAAHGGTAYTAGAGIEISGSTIRAKTATSAAYGAVTVLNAEDPTSLVDGRSYAEGDFYVPTAYTLKAYVESKMASAGAAYTGTAPVVVDNGSHTISVNIAPGTTQSDGVISRYNDSASALDNDSNDLASALASVVPSLNVMKAYVGLRTPDASTSVKGLVQLANGSTVTDNSSALTPASCGVFMQTIRNNRAKQAVDVQSLAGKLFVDPITGLVFYKPTA